MAAGSSAHAISMHTLTGVGSSAGWRNLTLSSAAAHELRALYRWYHRQNIRVRLAGSPRAGRRQHRVELADTGELLASEQCVFQVPLSEEQMLPCFHGNDRVEWFIQLSDRILWDVQDKATAEPRAKVVMNPGDVSAMPADIRHRGFSPKRSMLLVWENMTSGLEKLYAEGKLPVAPAEF